MRLLVVGGGGREHALAWKAAQSPEVSRVYAAPGNAGTALEPKVENVDIAAGDIAELCRFAAAHDIDLTVVGPEAPLVAGIVDAFQEAGLPCLGPNRAAARLEGSKAFCKDFLARHDIPTAAYAAFTAANEAKAYAGTLDPPMVVKADGLAAGKGVVIAHTYGEAAAAIDAMLSGRAFGVAGRRIVVEEYLRGEEASFIVLADGEHALPLATSRDHKARDDGDRGPNTGGMGAYSPAPVITPEIHACILAEIIEPTLAGMAAAGHPYRGFLYAGLMIGPDGTPKVLEFNCRLGDPETQPILMRLKSDLVILCRAALAGRLHEIRAEWDDRVALGAVLASAGYPEGYRTGEVISGLPRAEGPDRKVFHAGTRRQDHETVTAGGRVLCACALGEGIGDARRKAYALAEGIHWPGVYYRRDIGFRGRGPDSEAG